MKSYFCYIHTVGVLTPELRTIAAPAEDELPDLMIGDMTDWPALKSIELVEVCNDRNEVLFRIDPNQALAYRN